MATLIAHQLESAARAVLYLGQFIDLCDSCIVEATAAIAKRPDIMRRGSLRHDLEMAKRAAKMSQAGMRAFLRDVGNWQAYVDFLDARAETTRHDVDILYYAVKQAMDSMKLDDTATRARTEMARLLLEMTAADGRDAKGVFHADDAGVEYHITERLRAACGIDISPYVRRFSIQGAWRWWRHVSAAINSSGCDKPIVVHDKRVTMAFDILAKHLLDEASVSADMETVAADIELAEAREMNGI